MQVSIQRCKVLPTIFPNLTTKSFRLELMAKSTLALAFQMMTTLIYRELELQFLKVEHSSNTWDFVVRFGTLNPSISRSVLLACDSWCSFSGRNLCASESMSPLSRCCVSRYCGSSGESHRILCPATLFPQTTFIRDTNKKISGRLRLRKRPLFNLMGVNL